MTMNFLHVFRRFSMFHKISSGSSFDDVLLLMMIKKQKREINWLQHWEVVVYRVWGGDCCRDGIREVSASANGSTYLTYPVKSP